MNEILLYFTLLILIKSLLDDMQIQLWKACEDGRVEEVRKLLQNEQININWQDYVGETSFHVACEKGHLDIVKVLLKEKRISIRRKTNKGKTAFEIAKANNYSEIMKLIKEFDTGNLLNNYLQ